MVAAPLGPLYTLGGAWGGGCGVSLRGRARPFYGFRQNRNGPRASASAPRWEEQHRKANFPPPASHCSPSSSRVSPLFYCPTLSPPSPFPATAETKKKQKKKKQPTKRVSNVSKEEERGRREGGASVVRLYRLLRAYESRVL